MTSRYSGFIPKNWKQKALYWVGKLLNQTSAFEPILIVHHTEHIAYHRLRVQSSVDMRLISQKGYKEHIMREMFSQIGDELFKSPDMWSVYYQDNILESDRQTLTLEVAIVKPGEEQRRMVFREEERRA